MTEKQIEKVKQTIKKERAALSAERRKFGGFDDSYGRRYYIADLYIKIEDYKGSLRYKNWFNKNFPSDVGGAIIYLNWSISFFETGKIKETKANTIITAFQNINLHHMLLGGNIDDKEIIRHEYFQVEHFQKTVNYALKITTQNYIDWLRDFYSKEEYQKPIQEFKFLNHLLKNDNSYDERVEILNKIRALEKYFE